MKVFICPAGTSVLTVKGLDFSLIEHRPLVEFGAHHDFLRSLRLSLDNNEAHQKPLSHMDAVSAEFKSLIRLGVGRDDLVYLLVSDTVDGRFTAEVNEALLEGAVGCTDA